MLRDGDGQRNRREEAIGGVDARGEPSAVSSAERGAVDIVSGKDCSIAITGIESSSP